MIPKYVMLLILFIGILFIVVGLVKDTTEIPKTKIIYRYLPRTFEEEQNDPIYVTDIFKTMFTQQSPWVSSSNDIDVRKSEAMNKYFISQY